MQQASKARNGSGSLKWSPSKDRYVGQAKRNGKVIKTIYGVVGVKSPAEKLIVAQRLKPYLELPEDADAAITVESALKKFCDNPDLRPTTRSSYRAMSKNHVYDLLDKEGALIERRLGSKRVMDVRTGDIEKTLAAISPTKARTRLLVYKMLRAIFKSAVRRRQITFNPVEAIDAPKYARVSKIRVFTTEEQRYLREVETDDKQFAEWVRTYKPLLELMLSMPLRPCEAIAIRRCDLNSSTRRIHIQNDLTSSAENNYKPTLGPVKTPESDRYIYLTDETAPVIAKQVQDQLEAGRMTPESFLFTALKGGPIEHARLSAKWWRPLVAAAKAKAEQDARDRGDFDYRFPVIGLYGLRHTAIENLKAAGVERDVVAVLAGHASAATTDKHYNQPTEARKLEAADLVGNYLKRKIKG
jgi:integrase